MHGVSSPTIPWFLKMTFLASQRGHVFLDDVTELRGALDEHILRVVAEGNADAVAIVTRHRAPANKRTKKMLNLFIS